MTERSDTRASVWVGDGTAEGGSEVVSSKALGAVSDAQIAWAGDRLMYSRMSNGQLFLSSVIPGGDATVEVLSRDFGHFSAISDGGTIVFTATDGIWKAEADGRHPVKIASGNAGYPWAREGDRT